MIAKSLAHARNCLSEGGSGFPNSQIVKFDLDSIIRLIGKLSGQTLPRVEGYDA